MASATPTGPPLEVVSFDWKKDGEFGIAEGRVRNVSSAPVRDLFAIVTYADAQGGTLATAETTIDSAVLDPGNTSSFTVLIDKLKGVPAGASVRFRLLDGTMIEVKAATSKP